ncbi:MAG: hypothetical protein M3478_14230 [Planctomycetota bacterium]|nr:hypothetical protein [Planctomycetota bacterium]
MLNRFAPWLIVLPILVAVVLVQKIARERWGDWLGAAVAIVTLMALYVALHCIVRAMKHAAIRRIKKTGEDKQGRKGDGPLFGDR